jgi:YbbR domain-containing protein
VTLITDDWRLKLLALGLGILMLGAVAFSQNPPSTKTFKVPVHYTMSPDLVLINPPTTTTVTVNGLADVIGTMTSDSIVAVVDAASAAPGPAVKLNVTARSLVTGVTAQNPPPFAVNIDRLSIAQLQVAVDYRAAAGWEVTKAEARCPGSPCVVHFSGPAAWEVNLKAIAPFPNPIDNSSYDVLTQSVVLKQGNTTLDAVKLTQTLPTSGLDISTVSLHVEARTGTTSRSVALVDSTPSHPPPAGYRLTSVTIDPITVVVTGPADQLAQLQRIALPSVDLSNSRSTATFQIQIPYPAGMNGPPGIGTAKVTYAIAANPNISPSP